MTTNSTSDELAEPWQAWLDAVRTAIDLAYGDRLGELRGRRPKLMNQQGIHPFSAAWGAIAQLRAVLPDELRELIADGRNLLDVWPGLLRAAGQETAEAEFRAGLLAEAAEGRRFGAWSEGLDFDAEAS